MPELALLSYVAVMSITPGPNNLMLAASGVNHGVKKTLPHMLGISVGNTVQMFITASIFALIVSWVQVIRFPLAVIGCIYLLWLAWKMMMTASPSEAKRTKPMGFVGAVLFQWLNPKAWVMVINCAILFMPAQPGVPWLAALALALTSGVINLPCLSVWAWMGERLRVWLSVGRWLMVFNLTMAGLMAITALWLIWDECRLAFV